MENQTVLYMLFLSGLSDLPSLQLPLFLVFLLVYLMTLTGNLLIVLLICTDSHLQTPMYFFLGTLACLDMGYSSVTIPRMLFDLYTQKRFISIQACITQIYFIMYFALSEISLLAVMSYDRYVAICRPLHYTQIMHWKTCVLLVLGLLMISVVCSLVHVLLLLRLSFCRLTPLQSFFCELPQLLLVSCSDTFINVLLILITAISLGGGIFALTFCPYITILNTIMKMQSKAMRSKAFSTCSSHLTVVFLFYGTALFSYFHPNAKTNSVVDKVASVFYTVLTPLVNPLIYSLRNKILKTSLKRAVCRLIQI
ncbi:hypothetical protein GDO86_017810 [Hymenochirus boettgeri]|uniref:Olfactory receptor n=2 Tax=Hymenochirus boettgeri TaxID=247094 RepID=A0A8T2INR4_9PIPI|nr:hypothetical protein GDO86_018294 [Hymenochirus boettgeri]KAG8433622.1 hypothetical protein GDO86_017810 [Hymenochirus boettgeri]